MVFGIKMVLWWWFKPATHLRSQPFEQQIFSDSQSLSASHSCSFKGSGWHSSGASNVGHRSVWTINYLWSNVKNFCCLSDCILMVYWSCSCKGSKEYDWCVYSNVRVYLFECIVRMYVLYLNGLFFSNIISSLGGWL